MHWDVLSCSKTDKSQIMNWLYSDFVGPSGAKKATQRSIRFRQSRKSQEAARMSSVLNIVQCAHWVLRALMWRL